MLNRIKLILNNTKIMKRIGFTLLILLVYKLATYVPIPLLDIKAIQYNVKNSNFLEFLNAFSGGALGNYAIVALGISPYITASIVVQMLQMDVIPKFKEWSKQGEVGKQKLNQATKYIGLALAVVQSLLILMGLFASPGSALKTGLEGMSVPLAFVYMTIVMTAGTAFTMWLADLISRKGIGNGSSMIITAGIVSSIPSMITTMWNQFITNKTANKDIVIFISVMVSYLVVLIAVIFLESTVRKIPTQYANRQGKSDSNIPLKLNTAGVIPVIFASTLLSFPLTIVSYSGASIYTGWGYWFYQIFSSQNPIGFIIYLVLIFVFAFFYSFLTVSPETVAENLQKQNAFIPGVRPGEETHSYVSSLLFKITVLGGTYLAILAAIPIVMSQIFKLPSVVTVGGTSLIIIVGVAIETCRQIETEATETTYQGFMR